MMPAGDTSMFNPTDPQGNPTGPIVNQLVNFGWEYMLHCHILSHEEMDMMRPNLVAMPPWVADGLTWVITGNGRNAILTLTWNDNSITETEFIIQATANGATWTTIGNVLSPLDQPNTTGLRTFVDSAFRTQWIGYRVIARNTVGYLGFTGPLGINEIPYPTDFPSMSVDSISEPVYLAQVFFQYLPSMQK